MCEIISIFTIFSFEHEKKSKLQLTTEKDRLIDSMRQKLQEAENDNVSLNAKLNELKQIVAKLEDNLLKKEKLIQKKDEQHKWVTTSCEKLQAVSRY